MNIRKRYFKVIKVFFKIFLAFRKEFKIRKKRGFEKSQKIMFKTHTKRAWELYNVAISLGGVLIKLCQYLSTRRDIFPEPYIKVLSNLHDNVPPVNFDEIDKIIEEEYKDREFPFKFIDKNSLASASLGQTHKAILKSGEEVVLKILKPDIGKIIDIDFSILYHVFKLFSHIRAFKDFANFSNILEEFINVTGDELNFKREVEIAKRFKEVFKKFSYVKVPYIYEEYSNSQIIVMEYIDGVKITDKEKWINYNNDPVTIARRIVELYFEQFLTIKLIHFDPHPGNIFILKDNNIGLLDYGMSGEITDDMSKSIKDILTFFMKKDYKGILEIIKKLGFLDKNTNIYNLLPVVEYFFDEVADTIKLEQSSFQSINLNPVIDELVEIIYTHPFRLPYEWAYIGRTIGTLTGIISSLYPDFKLFEELKPYLDKFLRDNFSSIVEKGFDFTRTTFNEVINLPHKFDTLIDKVERGNIKFRVDFEEVDEKIISLGRTFAKGISIGMCFLSGTVAYLLYTFNRFEGALIFGRVSFFSLLYFLFYRRLSKKEIIKKTFF